MMRWLKTYLFFSRREINGLLVLLGLVLLVWGTQFAVSFLRPTTKPLDPERAAAIHRFVTTLQQQPVTQRATEEVVGSLHPIPQIDYFTFDPNNLPVVDWKRLGFTDRQVQVIKNYEAKGGRFRKKEDLQKIYVISNRDYQRLEPYIVIAAQPDAVNAQLERQQTVERSLLDASGSEGQALPTSVRTLYIELNSADSITLQQLPGVGPVFASRIVRFREILGGFYHEGQLLEVYGFDSLRYEGLKAHLTVDTHQMAKIPINTVDYALLRRHPYIDNSVANAIVRFREQHGSYRAISDLSNIAIVDAEFLRKIEPYLTFDP